jgi:DNA-binding transcriptional MerR regulator
MAMKKSFAMKKLYYSISEVSKITDLEQYVLRYWETEFEQLKPAKNLAGNRIYTNKDIKLIFQIKKLLREEKYTIEGAKNLLKNYTEKSEEEESPGSRLEILKNKTLTKQRFSRSDSELSLFNETENHPGKTENMDVPEHLKKDLTELKSFLTNLLGEIE